MTNLRVREDFRRDGLAANFLVGEESMHYLSKALPGSIINVGYPGICLAEYEVCKDIINKNPSSEAELAVVGHATTEHLHILSELVNKAENTSANFWIPASNNFIAKTFKNKETERIISDAEKLVHSWKYLSEKPLDIAITDITAKEEGLAQKVEEWTNRLHKAGARNIILCDTLGVANPKRLDELFSSLSIDYDRVEFHPHTDKNTSTKNVEIAQKHGIQIIGTAIYGAGERRTMIDPQKLIKYGLQTNQEAYLQFLESYHRVIPNIEEVLEVVFNLGNIVTGTQYRLRNRDKNLKTIFGVTSDRYILGEMTGTNREELSMDLLEEIKNDLLYKKKNIYLEEKKLRNLLQEDKKWENQYPSFIQSMERSM